LGGQVSHRNPYTSPPPWKASTQTAATQRAKAPKQPSLQKNNAGLESSKKNITAIYSILCIISITRITEFLSCNLQEEAKDNTSNM
jgi:hypothetical protein